MADENALAPAPGRLAPKEIADLLARPLVARLGVLDEGGYPYIVPIWYEFDGQAFWVVGREHVRYVPLLRRDPRCAISVAEDVAPYRRVLARGQAEIVEGPSLDGRWLEVLRRLTRRYLGPGGEQYLERSRHICRYLLRLEPRRMVGFRGFR